MGRKLARPTIGDTKGGVSYDDDGYPIPIVTTEIDGLKFHLTRYEAEQWGLELIRKADAAYCLALTAGRRQPAKRRRKK